MNIYEVTAKPKSNLDVILIAANEEPPEDPYITLWRSVLKQALFDATFDINQEDLHAKSVYGLATEKKRKAMQQQREKISAIYWFFDSDGDSNDVGSLEWICDHIGSHVDYERQKAREEIERAENDIMRKKYHKPKGTRRKPRRRVFHVVAGNAILGAS